jgi:hypothetical protein
MVIPSLPVNGLAPEIPFFVKKLEVKEFAGRFLGGELKTFRRGSPESFRGWAHQDSNLGPRDYESPALTAEL